MDQLNDCRGRRGGGPGDRALLASRHDPRTVGAHELLALQPAIDRPFGRHVHVDHVGADRRLRIGEDLASQLAAFAHQQLVEEEVHQLHVPGVADGLVVDVRHPAVERLADGAEAARGGERLQRDTLHVQQLVPFHRRHPLALAVLDHLAVVQVFVDHALGRPVEGVAHQASGSSGAARPPAAAATGRCRTAPPGRRRRCR